MYLQLLLKIRAINSVRDCGKSLLIFVHYRKLLSWYCWKNLKQNESKLMYILYVDHCHFEPCFIEDSWARETEEVREMKNHAKVLPFPISISLLRLRSQSSLKFLLKMPDFAWLERDDTQWQTICTHLFACRTVLSRSRCTGLRTHFQSDKVNVCNALSWDHSSSMHISLASRISFWTQAL